METTATKNASKAKSHYSKITKSPSLKLPALAARDEKMLRLKTGRAKFKKLLPDLLKKHEGKYATIIDGQVEIHENEEQLFKNVIEQYGYKSMYIGLITHENKVTRIRSPRIRNR
jgi:hypothetical protein